MKSPFLGKEIAAALTFKAAAIFLLYFAFFSGTHRTVVTPAKMAAALTHKPALEAR